MSYRVEELAARADISVDTVRYYQARDLLPPPIRSGRVALYSDVHIERLAEIRRLQGRGHSLAVIRRLLDRELDHADEALVAAVSAEVGADDHGHGEEWLTIATLAERSGIPLPLLQAVEREGLLVPRLHGGEPRYTPADVDAAAAGLRLLQHGLPLPELLDLARTHSAAMRATAERAVELFDAYIRRPLRSSEDTTSPAAGSPDAEAARRLVAAFEELLPATLTIVAHHFRRTLLAVAQEHIERVGSDGELSLVAVSAERRFENSVWSA
jgi:DNA-binding transcriptional MerR regulator